MYSLNITFCVVVFLITHGVDGVSIQQVSYCDYGLDAGLTRATCPGIGKDITEYSCLQMGCCWSEQPHKDQGNCFQLTKDSDDEFELENANGSDPPFFKIDLSGDFYSYDREDFSSYCTQQLGTLMQSKAQSMISPVNSRIGTEICLNQTTDDIVMVSTASSVSTNGIVGVAINSFVMRIGPYQTIESVYICADEIYGFLQPLTNWGVPIMPAPPGCPQPVFFNSVFDNVGDNWICLNNIDEATEHQPNAEPAVTADNTLAYEIRLAGDFVTYNGIPMDTQCTVAYSEQFLQKTFQMMNQVNSLIGSQLCPGEPGMILATATSSLSSTDSMGYTSSSFIASLEESMYFDWVYTCGRDLSVYLQEFENWGVPLLDQVPGCPIVIFQGNGFDETDQTWICV